MFTKTSDGSFLDSNGKVLYFSTERFIKDICEGDCCSICGISRSETDFNDEHVLPKWILRKYDLYKQFITLPNESKFRYDQYVLPCCKQCNSLMGEKIEQPVRNLITQGFEAVIQHIEKEGHWLFFVWLSLIFLKTHLKGKNLRYHRDRRQEDYTLFDTYNWQELHHIHCVARSFYTECAIDSKVMGSFLAIPAKIGNNYQDFDYLDLHDSKTLLLRVSDVCFITVFNDSQNSLVAFKNFLERLSGEMSPLQLREVVAHLAFINLHLKERPEFFTMVNLYKQQQVMSAKCPIFVDLDGYESIDFGEILYFCCKEFLSACNDKDIEQIKEQVKQGKLTFLFDRYGNFNTNSLVPKN
ncbi:MAG: hypothetical protein QNJ65_10625 [Xenococcaceae cyanobacterium MO_234.B1]|nr:hypothetical protein [Xenococcaceae cyanobacterium MO_234.B1]